MKYTYATHLMNWIDGTRMVLLYPQDVLYSRARNIGESRLEVEGVNLAS